jgi:hypothetical protein
MARHHPQFSPGSLNIQNLATFALWMNEHLNSIIASQFFLGPAFREFPRASCIRGVFEEYADLSTSNPL